MKKSSPFFFSFLLCGIAFAAEPETDSGSPYKDRRVPKVVPSDSPDYYFKGSVVDQETGESIYNLDPLIIRPRQFKEEIEFKKLKKQITQDHVSSKAIMEYIRKQSVVSEVLNLFILADLFPKDVPLFGFTSEEIATMYQNEAKLEKALDQFELFYPDDKNRSKKRKREKFELMKMKREAIDWSRGGNDD